MPIPASISPPARLWPAPALLVSLLLAACATQPPPPNGTAAPTAPTTSPTLPTPTVAAPAEQDHSQRFTNWVAAFSSAARAAGIDDATLRTAFETVRLVPRAIEADRAQPEFTRAVWLYLDSALSPQRLARGQAKLAQLRSTANGAPGIDIDTLAARYGVPPQVLVAIWGIESNYGTNMGDIPAIDALATLGFEGRREAWARAELLAALKILQNRDIDRTQMVGSWAGAMGQTQFLPSTFLAYAVDADGDGRRDIWGSLPDVMASTANFLSKSGWQANQPWGLEVRLPPGFDYARASATVRQGAASWAQEGVQTMDGTPLPEALVDAAVLLPAGSRGPAYLVGPNFRAVLRYNNSTSYALAVNLLAQQLAGGPAPQSPWPRDVPPLTRSQLLALQTALNARGFDTGIPDGVLGPATQNGVRQFQRSLGLPADGYPTPELLQRLQ